MRETELPRPDHEGPDRAQAGLPLVSIIIPAYNHQDYVATALRSALGQSYPAIEVIIIDDGSRDQTALRIAQVLAQNQRLMRIEFISRENWGLARSLNQALDLARGDYVQFLASDDALLAQMTERLVAAFDGAGAKVAAVACDGYVVDGRPDTGRDGGQIRPHRRFSQVNPRPFGRNQHREMLAGNWLPAIGVLYRREVVMGLGGFETDLVYEDWGLLLKLTQEHRVKQIDDLLFFYRQHASNISGNHAAMLAAQEALCAKFPAMAGVRHWRRAIGARDWRNILAGLRPGTLDLACRYGLRRLRGISHDLAAAAARICSRGQIRRAQAGRVVLEPGCQIGAGVQLIAGPGDLRLGAGCQIGAGARLVAGQGLRLGAGCYVGPGAELSGAGGALELGQGCLIGARAVIKPGSRLEDLVVVAPDLQLSGHYLAGQWILATSPKDNGPTP